ncbi:unnamed protein product [Protopolystoma xenopodis]|uniref:Uncharacterized protein n=1 Tax=Protopolystoma xenopodis TaxID=117903 RepID=A0A448WBT9_9PLAT|nr:unnamed protein product [Protopolystoma xenopodis]
MMLRMARPTDDADYESGEKSGNVPRPRLVRRIAKLSDDADYDADYDVGETLENVPSPLSDAGNHDNYYGR